MDFSEALRLRLCSAAVQPSRLLPAQAEHAAQPHPIKILGICCSPRKGKTTAAALSICLDAVKAFDGRIEVELIELAGRKIPGEVAAGVALEPGERDDFPALVPKLSEPAVAGIILGTPVYFGNMSSLCKAFLDRCIVFHKDKPLANKVAGVLAVGGAERRRGTDDSFGASGIDVAADDRGGRCLADRPLGRDGLGRQPRRQHGSDARHRPRRGRHRQRQKPWPSRGRDGAAVARVRSKGVVKVEDQRAS